MNRHGQKVRREPHAQKNGAMSELSLREYSISESFKGKLLTVTLLEWKGGTNKRKRD